MESAQNQSTWQSPYGLFVQVNVWIVVVALSLETIIGNAMVIAAYKIERTISRQISNRYIVSLAISDLIIGIEGYPLFTLYVLNGDHWPLGWLACETWLFLDYTLCLVSILTVLLITMDRYLSVCHTASYIKWQTPTKAQITIIISWVVPTCIFGFMIYGWSLFSDDSAGVMNGECAAPFLANPYVNMAMYVIYYWTTLIAMLILYKGIHKVTKKLEKRAGAKEQRHLALLFSQRLGTQVGVKLLLSRQNDQDNAGSGVEQQKISEDICKDSDYHTFTTNVPTSINNCNESRSLESAEASADEMKSAAAPSQLVNESNDAVRHSSSNHRVHVRTSSSPTTSMVSSSRLNYTDTVGSSSDYYDIRQTDSMSVLENNENDDGSWQLEAPIAAVDYGISTEDLNGTAASSSCSNGANEAITTTNHQKQQPTMHAANRSVIHERCTNAICHEAMSMKRHSTRWVKRIKKHVSGVFGVDRRNYFSSRSPSSSISSTSSAENAGRKSARVPGPVPMVTITRQESVPKSVDDKTKDSTFLSTRYFTRRQFLLQNRRSAHLKYERYSRKFSSLSSLNLRRDRMLQTIFSPLSLFNRQRKQTKAERRAHKAFRTITFIVGCFAILWSPYYVVATVYGFCRHCIPSLVYTLTYYMCYMNSSGNPFAYALANRQFRAAFIRMLQGNFKKNF